MVIGALQKTSLIDYPGKISAIVFTAGCNFNCGFCHNPSLREIKPVISEKEFFDFLKSRVGKLEAVTITGGEPTLHKDLPEFAKKIKDLGFLVKLDSQGSNPDMIERMINDEVVDYIAMDIKGPLEKYDEITRVKVDKDKIKQSIKLLMEKSPDYEFRTTTVAEQLDVDDFEKIGELIKGAKRYYIQKFVPAPEMNDMSFASKTRPGDETLEKMRNIAAKYVSEVGIR